MPRTTLNLDEDVIQALALIARPSGKTWGQLASPILRAGLKPLVTAALAKLGDATQPPEDETR